VSSRANSHSADEQSPSRAAPEPLSSAERQQLANDLLALISADGAPPTDAAELAFINYLAKAHPAVVRTRSEKTPV